MSKLPLSQRIRPNSEAAPWVIEEIKKLEADAKQSIVTFTDYQNEMEKYCAKQSEEKAELEAKLLKARNDYRALLDPSGMLLPKLKKYDE